MSDKIKFMRVENISSEKMAMTIEKKAKITRRLKYEIVKGWLKLQMMANKLVTINKINKIVLTKTPRFTEYSQVQTPV